MRKLRRTETHSLGSLGPLPQMPFQIPKVHTIDNQRNQLPLDDRQRCPSLLELGNLLNSVWRVSPVQGNGDITHLPVLPVQHSRIERLGEMRQGKILQISKLSVSFCQQVDGSAPFRKQLCSQSTTFHELGCEHFGKGTFFAPDSGGEGLPQKILMAGRLSNRFPKVFV